MLSITTDQMSAAAGYIARNWGDYGYRVELIESWTERVTLFYVVASDGARFVVGADTWGNCQHADRVDWRGYKSEASTAALSEFVSGMHATASVA